MVKKLSAASIALGLLLVSPAGRPLKRSGTLLSTRPGHPIPSSGPIVPVVQVFDIDRHLVAAHAEGATNPECAVSGIAEKSDERSHRGQDTILDLHERFSGRGQQIIRGSEHIVSARADPAARGCAVEEKRANACARSAGARAPVSQIERRQVRLLPRDVGVRFDRPAAVCTRPSQGHPRIGCRRPPFDVRRQSGCGVFRAEIGEGRVHGDGIDESRLRTVLDPPDPRVVEWPHEHRHVVAATNTAPFAFAK